MSLYGIVRDNLITDVTNSDEETLRLFVAMGTYTEDDEFVPLDDLDPRPWTGWTRGPDGTWTDPAAIQAPKDQEADDEPAEAEEKPDEPGA